MFATELDPVPWQQGYNMYQNEFVVYWPNADVAFHKINMGGDHAFNYWYETDGADSQGRCVKQEVIDFLNEYP
jgi:hypothetical protein